MRRTVGAQKKKKKKRRKQQQHCLEKSTSKTVSKVQSARKHCAARKEHISEERQVHFLG